MKKTFMLASLIAMTAVASGTTGKVYLGTGTESKFEKTIQEHKISESKIGTEVKVKDTGFSFGGEFKLKDVKGFIAAPSYALATKDSNVWAKYELPEIKGINSSIKATYKETTKLNLEGDVNYTINGVKVGLNSNTTLSLKLEENKKLGEETVSEHKLYVEAKEASVLKDVKANIKLVHTYNTIEKNAKAIKNVSGEAEVTYDKVKDLKLTGKINFKRNINSDLKDEYKMLNYKLYAEAPIRYMHSYELNAEYTGIKHLTIMAKPFVAHFNGYKISEDEKKNVIVYGSEFGAEYKMLNDKLTLTGKTLLAGRTSDVKFVSKIDDVKDRIKLTQGIFVFDVNVKYNYDVTNKFKVSPEANAYVSLVTYMQGKKRIVTPNLTLTPKVNAEYKPIENLTLKGGVELPIEFGNVNSKFDYKSTTIKTSLNVEYKW